AEKIVGLDVAVVVAGLARHAKVFDHAAVAPFTTLDGEQAAGRTFNRGAVAEIGGYVVAATRNSPWDAIVDLLACLETEHPRHFHRLMRECVRLSSGPREADGAHNLLDEFEQEAFDLACERAARRENRGHVTPAQARAFLEAARRLRLDAD